MLSCFIKRQQHLVVGTLLAILFCFLLSFLDGSISTSKHFLVSFSNVYPALKYELFTSKFSFYKNWIIQERYEWFKWIDPTWKIPVPKSNIDSRLPSTKELHHDAVVVDEIVKQLRYYKFFRIFKIDLEKKCSFWTRQPICTTRSSCFVCECDQTQIPLRWQKNPVQSYVEKHHYNDSDVISWESNYNEISLPLNNEMHVMNLLTSSTKAKEPFFYLSDEPLRNASYVDLTLNHPAFTGYQGSLIWKLIYQENCMPPSEGPSWSTIQETLDPTQCTEEEAFYKMISGMQTSIALHSSRYYYTRISSNALVEKIKQYAHRGHVMTSEMHKNHFFPSFRFFRTKAVAQREWIENLYFTFGVLLKTLSRVTPILHGCNCDTGTPDDDLLAFTHLRHLLNYPLATFKQNNTQGIFFYGRHNLAIKQLYNISRLVDCVECEKCRLHGKMKIVSLQLALKALGHHNYVKQMERNEIIALINTLGYFAESILILDDFTTRRFLFLFFFFSAFGLMYLLLLISILWYRMHKKQKSHLKSH